MGEVKWSEWVIGCNVGGQIYMNPHLQEDKQLYNAILIHERCHTAGYSKQDFYHDIINDELKGVKGKYWRFILSHPKTWVSFLPITRVNKQWTIDITMGAFWFAVALVSYLIWRF